MGFLFKDFIQPPFLRSYKLEVHDVTSSTTEARDEKGPAALMGYRPSQIYALTICRRAPHSHRAVALAAVDQGLGVFTPVCSNCCVHAVPRL